MERIERLQWFAAEVIPLATGRGSPTQVYSADLTFRRNCLQHDPPSDCCPPDRAATTRSDRSASFSILVSSIPWSMSWRVPI